MAIKIGGTTVINDSRGLENISNVKTINGESIFGEGDLVIVSGASSYTANVGNGSNTSYTITHNLGKTGLVVTVRDNSTGYFVYPDIKYTSNVQTVLEFVDAPTANQYLVAIIG